MLIDKNVGNIYSQIFNEKIIENEKSIEKNANEILKLRYFLDLPNDEKETSFKQLCRRVSRTIVANEQSDDINYKKNIEKHIYNDMLSHKFLFNSPCLFSAGVGISNNKELSKILYSDDITREGYNKIKNNISENQMLFACFVIDVPDDLEGIFDSVKNAAIISKSGGGVGANFGKLREKGALIRNGDCGTSSGPVSFMQTWNTMGSVVVQGGKRRAALMGMLNSNHPDIEEFINCKTEEGNLNYFNISVAIDDKFMYSVRNDLDYCLISPKDNKVIKIVKAKELWDKICNAAYKRGDPGVFFIDLANKDSLLKNSPDYYISSTNPCGEQPLNGFCSCNLGSINVSEFVVINKDNNSFDYLGFAEQIVKSIYYLDLVIDSTSYPLEIIEKKTKSIRPIGLGIMGLADTAIKLGIVYGSKEFNELCENIGKYLAVYSLIATIELAELKGSYPVYDSITKPLLFSNISKSYTKITKDDLISLYNNMIYNKDIPESFKNALKGMYQHNKNNLDIFNYFFLKMIKFGLRNSRRLSIAPTGSLSMILNTSPGIEPNFAYSWDRLVSVSANEKTKLTYYHKLYNKDDKDNPLYVTATNLTVDKHLEPVKIFAKYVDSGISKTVNVPNTATVDEIKYIYEYCFDNNIKGITIYRDGSRDNQPIQSIDNNKNVETKKIEDNNIIKVPVNKENYGGLKDLPQFLPAIRSKCSTPYGSLYVISTFYENKIVEIFISCGKAGGINKAMTESLSRVISIGLRSGVDINNIIKTISGISDSEMWCYTNLKKEDVWVKSIPDNVAKVLADTVELSKTWNNISNEIEDTVNKQLDIISNNKTVDNGINELNDHNKLICPECGSKMIMTNGCGICPACGFSYCK